MPAEVLKAYPYSEYRVKEKQLDQADLAVADDAAALLDRRLTLAAFTKKYGAKEGDWQGFLDRLDVTSFGTPLPIKDRQVLQRELAGLLVSNTKNPGFVAANVLRRFYGYALIEPLFEDEELEEIVVNGCEEPVWVYHRSAGLCRTNLQFNPKQLDAFLGQLGGRDLYDDLRLSDGSRANIIKPPAAPWPSVTIRVFHQHPFSLVSLIKANTLSPEVAALLWTAFEGVSLFPLNVLIAGGTAAGKTTMLNALASLIPPDERLVTIEDTPELNFVGRQNWVPLFSGKHADAQELLINALRMRPDRLIVGDMRGGEAETLFTAMNTGHRGASGTFHANSDRDAIVRLENTPMNVPKVLLPLADLIVIQQRFNDRRLGTIRRVTQVTEITRGEDGPALNQVFTWNSNSDFLEKTSNPTATIEKLATATNRSNKSVMDLLEERKGVLDYLVQKDVSSHEAVCKFMAEYYKKAGENG